MALSSASSTLRERGVARGAIFGVVVSRGLVWS